MSLGLGFLPVHPLGCWAPFPLTFPAGSLLYVAVISSFSEQIVLIVNSWADLLLKSLWFLVTSVSQKDKHFFFLFLIINEIIKILEQLYRVRSKVCQPPPPASILLPNVAQSKCPGRGIRIEQAHPSPSICPASGNIKLRNLIEGYYFCVHKNVTILHWFPTHKVVQSLPQGIYKILASPITMARNTRA